MNNSKADTIDLQSDPTGSNTCNKQYKIRMDIITGAVIDLDGSDTKMHTEDRKSISYNLAERKNKYKKGTCRRKRKLCRFMGYEVFTLNTHGNISTKYWVMI